MYAKTVKAGLLAAALTVSLPGLQAAQANGGALPGAFSANVALVSDYVVRGISLSNEDPAIQGGFDWEGGNGLFLGTWGSSVEFGNDSSVEIDFYAGYRGRVDAFGYEARVAYYWYPDTSATGSSFWDAHVKGWYDLGAVVVNAGLAYTPDNFGPTADDAVLYYSAGAAVPVAEMLTVSAGVGYSALEGFKDYTDWNAGATLKVRDWFNVDVRYYDTNFTACGRHCDARVVAKVSRVF